MSNMELKILGNASVQARTNSPLGVHTRSIARCSLLLSLAVDSLVPPDKKHRRPREEALLPPPEKKHCHRIGFC